MKAVDGVTTASFPQVLKMVMAGNQWKDTTHCDFALAIVISLIPPRLAEQEDRLTSVVCQCVRQ